MRTTEVDFEGRLPIDGYAPGGFRVAGAVHRGPLALRAGGRRGRGAGCRISPPLRGTGGELRRSAGRDGRRDGRCPDGFAAARGALEAAGAGVEIMATPSACRTYNVLLGEGRRVAAALMPV